MFYKKDTSEFFKDPLVIILLIAALIQIFLGEIVPGDLMILEAGDYILADGKIIKSQTLKIMEGTLTGESEAVLKNSDTILIDVP